MNALEQLLKEYMDVFVWTYKDFKEIPLELAKHIIELDGSISQAHQTKYRMNPNYIAIIKQNIHKLLTTKFTKHVEKITWLSLVLSYCSFLDWSKGYIN
jgi:hypothetical protein